MNIKITYNWLLEFLETDATAYEIQKYLSLCGPSVESVQKIEGDYVFDIEVTSNRIDNASVIGIAQECLAILPQFGKKAKLKFEPLAKYSFKNLKPSEIDCLKIKLTNQKLCSRFAAIVLSDVSIQSAPEFIKERLVACGIKSINNVVDISNYLMVTLGQPTHIFDFNQIKKLSLTLRESIKGEKVITLEEKEITLPGGDIVIEDGEGRLIDLCGIMGGLNSSVTAKTKNVLLFVQTYNKQLVRKTTMTTGQRSVASSYFEKGLDEERVEPTLAYGVELLEKYAEGKIASKLYDIYPDPYKAKTVALKYEDIDRVIGITINKKEVNTILEDLNLKFKLNSSSQLAISIPSYRKYDLNIKEDIIEEIARVYGYYKLPNNLPPAVYVKQPKQFENLFLVISKIKYFLKHLGFHETINYSMVSKELLEKFDLKTGTHLKISNSISKEIEYLRRSLLPSLVKNIKDNEGKEAALNFFEIAKVYWPKKTTLPEEKYQVGLVTNTDFFTLKGIIEALFKELNIDNYQIKSVKNNLFTTIQGEIIINKKTVGCFGQLSNHYRSKNNIKESVYLLEIDLQSLVENFKLVSVYKPINPFAVIKLDLTIELTKERTFSLIKERGLNTSKFLQKIEFLGLYQNRANLRFYFSSLARNLTEEEAKKELEKIKESVLK